MRVAVTGLGMMSTVGFTVKASCAAMRAGISRPAPLAMSVLDSEEPELRPVVGHPVPQMAGFGALPRLIRLGAWALGDLVREYARDLDDAGWRRTGLVVCVSPFRADGWTFLDEQVRDELPQRLLAHCGSLPLALLPVRFEGRASVLLGLEQAAQLLSARQLDRVVVLGVDSLVTTEALEWLASRHLLKTAEHATGLMPGEAAACVMVESDAVARSRQARVCGYIEQLACEEVPAGAERPPQLGRRLAKAVLECWPTEARVGNVFGDLNGHAPRAEAWGHALVHLRMAKRDVDGLQLDLPAETLGDTGAASGAISICGALRGFARSYARAPSTLVFGSEEPGHAVAARLSGGCVSVAHCDGGRR